MKVTVRAFATLREIMGKEMEIEVSPGETIRGLLAVLVGTYPGLQDALFERDGRLKSLNNILKNGRNIAFLDNLDTVLAAGDAIAIFPPVGGG
jgi:molybdopterin synthase sulfur carrier subunit